MTRVGNLLVRAALAALLLAPLGWAQEEDRPALGVARVSLTNGDVTIRRGDSGDWIQAPVNTPVVEGDRIATGAASRAEVQLDHSNLLRLNESSEVHMANLGNKQFRVQVERGVVSYSELRGGEADVDLETPLVAVRPGKNGRYRVEVIGQDLVRIIVRKGQAEVASAQGIETLKQGRMMVVRRGAEKSDGALEFAIEKAEPKDNWDEFNERRDKSLQKSESYRKLSSSIYGAEDLDDAGRWQYVSGYGNSWFPTVSAGWAPYRSGRWTWVDYYGWTWVSYERWGWAPYHYGRWFPPRAPRLGLVSGIVLRPSLLAAGVGRLLRLRALRRRARLQLWVRFRTRPSLRLQSLRLDSAGSGRALQPLVRPAPRRGATQLRLRRQQRQHLQQLPQRAAPQRGVGDSRRSIRERTGRHAAEPASVAVAGGGPDARPTADRALGRKPWPECVAYRLPARLGEFELGDAFLHHESRPRNRATSVVPEAAGARGRLGA